MKLENLIENTKEIAICVGIEAIPVAWGAMVSGFGKWIDEPMTPVFPILYDLMWNGDEYFTLRGIWTLLKYGIGVTLPYADKICPIAKDLIHRL